MARNKGLKMDLTGGRPKTGNDLRQAFEATQAVPKGAAETRKILRKHSPIGATRRLSTSWVLLGNRGWQQYKWQENITNAAANNGYRYAGRVNRVSKRNAGYIERAMQEANGVVPTVMGQAAGSVELWDGKAK